jgi:hypothetical protein
MALEHDDALRQAADALHRRCSFAPSPNIAQFRRRTADVSGFIAR